MDLLTADMECFYDNDYSLSKMTTEHYLRDPRMEEILWSIKWNDTKSFWLLPDRAAHFFKHDVDWANTALICHHSHFDGARLNWGHDCRPALHIDTLSMARIIDGPKAGNSLHDLCIRHGVGAKGDYVTFAKGKHLADFTKEELAAYGAYSCNDADRTYDLAQKFLPLLPMHELQLIDKTIRMFTEPVFVGDTEKLRGAVITEWERKIELLRRVNLLCSACGGFGVNPDLFPPIEGNSPPCKKCEGLGVDKKPIGSNEQFANLLRAFGVEPETKPSPTSGAPIYAFARTDAAMQELLEHPDEGVRFLAEARVGIKSNIIETRAQRFLGCAQRGPMPVYLAHGGAHTRRPSGGDSMNWLNMSKHNDKRPEMTVLRQSVMAPPGHKIVTADSKQGEARILAWLADQRDLVDAFAQGRDVYSEHASTIYGRPIDRVNVKEDYIPGQVGKIGILSYGFGAGWYKSATELLKGALGAPPIQFTQKDVDALQVDTSRFYNNPKKVQLVDQMPSRLGLNDRLIHCAVSEALIQRYRAKYQKICGKEGFWNLMESAINAMIEGREMVFGAHGIFRTSKERIDGPTGMWLDYRGIQRDNNGEASYFDGRQRTKIYGSLLTENIVQHTHRLIVAEQLLAVSEVVKVALWPYDEVVCVVPDEAAEMALQFMLQVMKKTPSWAPGLPLDSEGGIGDNYAEAS